MAPTFYQMTQHLDPAWGWPLIAASLILAVIFGCLALFLPAKQEAPSKLSQTDFAAIDQKHSFMIFELACFWVGEKADLPLSKTANKQFKKLEAASKKSQLKVASTTTAEAIENAITFQETGKKPNLNPYWTVNRDEVIVYAKRVKQKPAFLYRENRVHG